MTLDRHILAFAESKPVTSSAASAAFGTWAFWQQLMERGTTVCSFLVAVGGLALFIYNLRAARRKRRIKANLPCMQCGYDGKKTHE